VLGYLVPETQKDVRVSGEGEEDVGKERSGSVAAGEQDVE
jgi:hypothetical protein